MEEATSALEGHLTALSNTNTDIVQEQWKGPVKGSKHHYLLDSVKIFGGDLLPMVVESHTQTYTR